MKLHYFTISYPNGQGIKVGYWRIFYRLALDFWRRYYKDPCYGLMQAGVKCSVGFENVSIVEWLRGVPND